jgi:hypothetical protein
MNQKGVTGLRVRKRKADVLEQVSHEASLHLWSTTKAHSRSRGGTLLEVGGTAGHHK